MVCRDYLQPAQHEALELPLRTEPFWPGDAWAENHGLPHDRWWPKPLYRNGDVIHLNHRGHKCAWGMHIFPAQLPTVSAARQCPPSPACVLHYSLLPPAAPLSSDLQVASELVIHWMQHMLDDVARHPLEPEDEEEAQRPLPEPMFKVQPAGCHFGNHCGWLVVPHAPQLIHCCPTSLPPMQGNYEAANNTCMTRKEFKNLVTVLDGAVWEWVIEGTDVVRW